MQSSPLSVTVLKDRYPTSFMSPRVSRHKINRARFVPFNFVRQAYDGFTIIEPKLKTDLVHVLNRVPLYSGKFICSHESGIPRYIGLKPSNPVIQYVQSRLESRKCRRILGMSHYANVCAEKLQNELGRLDRVQHKMMVQHPNIHLGPEEDQMSLENVETLVLTFTGAHFARKGGCVSVRVAELAQERGLPIHVNIISSLQVGDRVWTDPTQPGFFDRYFKLLDLPNVTHYERLPNNDVREVMSQSHFTLLPSFADTFGYSAIEGMAEHTPAITTNIAAMPEFMKDGFNGLVLNVERDEVGDWVRPDYSERDQDYYATYFADAVEALAEEIVTRLEHYLNHTQDMAPMRRNARRVAEEMFAAPKISRRWDELYQRVAAEDTQTEVELDPVLDRSSAASVDEALGLTSTES